MQFEHLIARLDRLEAEVSSLQSKISEDLEPALRDRDRLAEALLAFIDSLKAGENLHSAFDKAEAALAASGYFDEIPAPLAKIHVDRWIDAFRTAPPDLEPSTLLAIKEAPHPNPPRGRQ
jgi:hypothetical protein